ncbi:hypothetical protein KPH14_006429 [Odynerus spinipes]|uniref:Uncharacterized protein n=1 Tax=Odynerus spinipes TaxID=1348599 RepID=A0AAD9RQB4_9HYME|nr:hypothetical protein KPH14_006429 [Odynerus spinipes]
MQRQRLPDTMALLVRAAVLAAVLGQILPSGLANRPAGAHPGHAYFEQPCCGRSHLRHHKEGIVLFNGGERIGYFEGVKLYVCNRGDFTAEEGRAQRSACLYYVKKETRLDLEGVGYRKWAYLQILL